MIQALIFDLGNVIIRCSFEKAFSSWAASLGRASSEVSGAFAFDDEYRRFEKGFLSPIGYEAHVAALLQTDFPPGAFAAGWNAILGEIIPGMSGLLERLERRYRLVALSNTNALHHPVWSELCRSVLERFEKVFSSFQIHARKPEAAAFAAVLDYLRLAPGETVFLDDLPENVAAARALGMEGVVVSSAAALAAGLEALGVEA